VELGIAALSMARRQLSWLAWQELAISIFVCITQEFRLS